MRLFKDVAGIFRGFSEGGLEFHADLILPYHSEFQSIPMHGQFLVVQLESENEGVLGRITSVSSEGKLASSYGEDYSIRAAVENRDVPEDLRDQYLKYRVQMRVLGVLRVVGEKLVYAASHRRLPHMGSKVSFLSDEVLLELANHNLKEASPLGFYALGEFIYADGDERLDPEPWMQLKRPAVVPRFDVRQLVSKRSFVFARAGFGKSNLVKLLFSGLYKETPVVEKRGGRRAPVGTVIFDPDGEYFWPDDKGRPGLCDVPELQENLVVFTNRKGPSAFYESFVAGPIKLDLRRFRASDVIPIAVSAERQEQQNIHRLKGLDQEKWKKLVDEVYRNKYGTEIAFVKQILALKDGDEAQANAALSNMVRVVNMLHDPASQMLDMLIDALRDGKLCVVDVSQMRGKPSFILAGLILRRIFDYNQEQFTDAVPSTIPTIMVLEEAQSIFSGSSDMSNEPYLEWVKEGRKYDLGACLITQQPGSIPHEILSQGDNWFVFHLLSAGDVKALKSANAHFSDDLLASLVNEPIPGNGLFWSSAGGKAYPIPIRVILFEKLYRPMDPDYSKPARDIFALKLKEKWANKIAVAAKEEKKQVSSAEYEDASDTTEEINDVEGQDILEIIERRAIDSFKNSDVPEKIRKSGVPWRGVMAKLESYLPEEWTDRADRAYNLVPKALSETFGEQEVGWSTEKRPKKSGSGTTVWVIIPKAR
ncbi:MAG: DUF87 domain-containing protein [Candidatus Methanomethyliaceae archaeon]